MNKPSAYFKVYVYMPMFSHIFTTANRIRDFLFSFLDGIPLLKSNLKKKLPLGPLRAAPDKKGGKPENGRIASPENVSSYNNFFFALVMTDMKQFTQAIM